MKPEIEELYSKLSKANIVVAQLEHEIGNVQRECKHVRDPDDLNWCLHCGARLSADYKQDGE